MSQVSLDIFGGAITPDEPEATSVLDQSAKDQPMSVAEAVAIAKGLVSSTATLTVTGEVSGFRGPNARSGHCYFEVKDDSAVMSVCVWRQIYQASGVELRDGMQVQLSGKFDVYAGNGRLSFIARKLNVAGEGLLRQQVAALARKLEAEGLMAPERKRPIPRFCTRIAVVTSLSGSVIDDVRRTLARRNPLVELQMVGCKVQGEGAPATIMRALEVAAAAKPDAILLVRGGGSFEDLMTFNDESLARAVAASPVPVITGIGHEPDTCICDMVADRRTSTPTAAAESVAPAIDELATTINERAQRLGRSMANITSNATMQLDTTAARASRSMQAILQAQRFALDALGNHRCLMSPAFLVEDRKTALLQSEQRLMDALPRVVQTMRVQLTSLEGRVQALAPRITRPYEQQLASFASTLDALSPLKVLGRGYAITTNEQGHVLKSASQAKVGQSVNIRLEQGSLAAQVTATHVD